MEIVPKRRVVLTALLITSLLMSACGAVQLYHRLAYGHFVSIGMHLDVESEQTSIGIPGQTHLYWAELSNFGPWPRWFAACDYVSDTLTPGTDYYYAVQRWDEPTKNWKTVGIPDSEESCVPIPLSRGETQSTRHLIWPGQSVRVMEFEATGAREEFRHGDHARFLVFQKGVASIDWSNAVISRAFRIEDDVAIDDEAAFRIRH